MTWQKILYKPQPYPDNYSGGKEKFLSELRKNVSVVSFSYFEAVFGSLNLIYHINTIVLYFILYSYCFTSTVALESIVTSFVIGFLVMYVIHRQFLSLESIDSMDHAHTFVTLVVFGFGLTPLIRTLSDTISGDTVYALSLICSCLSCVFHDYGLKGPIVSGPLSLSLGLCSSIFLLSRLEDNSLAFVLLSVSFIIHACSSSFRNELFATYPNVAAVLSGLLALLTIRLQFVFNPLLAVLLTLLEIFIVFVCPLILVNMQKSKRTIHGPWDEAIPS